MKLEEISQQGNAQTPNRCGGDSDAPSPPRTRTDSQEDRIAGADEICARHRLVMWDRVVDVAAYEGSCEHAIRIHMAGWPTYEVLHPEVQPVRGLDHQIWTRRIFGLFLRRIRLLALQVLTPCRTQSSLRPPQSVLGLNSE